MTQIRKKQHYVVIHKSSIGAEHAAKSVYSLQSPIVPLYILQDFKELFEYLPYYVGNQKIEFLIKPMYRNFKFPLLIHIKEVPREEELERMIVLLEEAEQPIYIATQPSIFDQFECLALTSRMTILKP